MFNKIFNTFNVSNDVLNNISKININQNASLDYVINELNKNNIDLKKLPIGLLSKITFTEFKFFNNITIDEIFFIIISFITLIIIMLRNYNFIESRKFNFSKQTKKIFKKFTKYLNYFLGFIYLLYSIYMIKLIFCNKQFILISRYSYMYTYFITGITLLSSLYYYWHNKIID
jgi:hypothetical protein